MSRTSNGGCRLCALRNHVTVKHSPSLEKQRACEVRGLENETRLTLSRWRTQLGRMSARVNETPRKPVLGALQDSGSLATHAGVPGDRETPNPGPDGILARSRHNSGEPGYQASRRT